MLQKGFIISLGFIIDFCAKKKEIFLWKFINNVLHIMSRRFLYIPNCNAWKQITRRELNILPGKSAKNVFRKKFRD